MAIHQVRFWLIALLLSVLVLYLLRGILLPFVAGMALAYMLDPLCDRLQRLGLSRTLATTVVSIGLLLVITGAMLLLLPLLQDQIVQLIERLPAYVDLVQTRVLPRLLIWGDRFGIHDIAELQSTVSAQLGAILRWISSALLTLVTGGLVLVNLLSLIFITPVVAFYLLRDWDAMVARVDSWLPRQHAATIRDQAQRINISLAGFIRGQALVCLFLALYNGLGLTLIGLDFGLAIGVMSGVLSFIPYVGTITGFVVSMAVAMAQFPDWLHVGMVATLFFVGQFIEGNFLTPRLVGGRIGLHPVWVIFALLAGGLLFGFVGLLLAVPVAAIIGVLTRFALRRYLESPYYTGVQTVPAEASPAILLTPADTPAARQIHLP